MFTLNYLQPPLDPCETTGILHYSRMILEPSREKPQPPLMPALCSAASISANCPISLDARPALYGVYPTSLLA